MFLRSFSESGNSATPETWFRTPIMKGTTKRLPTANHNQIFAAGSSAHHPRPGLRAVRALRRNVYPRHHKERGENCVEQDARAVGTPSHNLFLLPKGCISLSVTYEESGALYVICVTLGAAQIVSTTTAIGAPGG